MLHNITSAVKAVHCTEVGTLTIGNFEASKYPKLFNPSEPGRGRGQVVQGGSVCASSGSFNHIQQRRTSLNNSNAERTVIFTV